MYHTIYHTKNLFKKLFKKVLTIPDISGIIKTVKRDKENNKNKF